ncbi:MAG: hypothetical protein M3347_04895 [Armatimonadota bacterium]|nr:hypothetical protein [Armatimonadota bacterium]
MNIFREWPHNWFGWWREYGERYEDFPSIHSFMDKSWEFEAKDKLINYLMESQALAHSPSGRSCIFNQCRRSKIEYSKKHLMFPGPQTDGVWLWFADLSHYVKYHDIRLPDSMVTHIVSNNFIPQQLASASLQSVAEGLDWPFTNPFLLNRGSFSH